MKAAIASRSVYVSATESLQTELSVELRCSVPPILLSPVPSAAPPPRPCGLVVSLQLASTDSLQTELSAVCEREREKERVCVYMCGHEGVDVGVKGCV